mmetsp:Transcript_22719/g.45392  ORF Transcript_22719/g.45392 Transcript_22719/m.45392 type:complete len:469 (+) Transcript_22719:196-1602(+)|eukprot:CAMPEP_0171343778 /NCGR_PEP_ID=MMETSP0878-20121228/18028_1 /TAXON_ID=67004 /ORGANISM="Thalassiosira weissflogii, Strain CCMP1336" /LENGTH=468 /DNA_ID=CAMNT_0011846805 /DNA_START=81 /DNA_END=1487 /DNA_ORIENTATION=-
MKFCTITIAAAAIFHAATLHSCKAAKQPSLGFQNVGATKPSREISLASVPPTKEVCQSSNVSNGLSRARLPSARKWPSLTAMSRTSQSKTILKQSTKEEVVDVTTPIYKQSKVASSTARDEPLDISLFVVSQAVQSKDDGRTNTNNAVKTNAFSIRSAFFSAAAALLFIPLTFSLSQSSLLVTSSSYNDCINLLATYLRYLQFIPTLLLSTYSAFLLEYPVPTKSITSGILCGISDALAQYRDKTRKEFNFGRWIRFAGKGCVGGVIWPVWYDSLDSFLNLESDFNIYKLFGFIGGGDSNGVIMESGFSSPNPYTTSNNYQWIKSHTNILTTSLSILVEQFIWCPLVFSSFEIPVSTILNGETSPSKIQNEVNSKLGGLLVSNAKVWTLANVIIYNASVEWRPVIANVVDVLWQSIVSDVAADCGKVVDDVCEVGELDDVDGDRIGSLGGLEVTKEKDYSFFAEKSRI